MAFTVTARPAELFAGVVAPRIVPGPESSGSEWMRFLHERIRERYAEPVAVSTVYVPDAHGTYNALVAVPVTTPDEVESGDVFVSVPSGVYAMFTPNGSLSDRTEDVWAQADEASESGEIFRAYKEEVEVVTSTGEVELYISIVI